MNNNNQEEIQNNPDSPNSKIKKNMGALWILMVVFIAIFGMTNNKDNNNLDTSINSDNNNSNSGSDSSSSNNNNNNGDNIEALANAELSSNETLSLNYLLKYVMPEGFREAYELQNSAEIVLVNELKQESLIGDIIPKNEFPMEEFFLAHSDIFEGVEDTISTEVVNDIITIGDKQITTICQFIQTGETEFYYTVNTIEFNDNSDQYLGFTGAINTIEANDLILDFLKSIEKTSISLNSVRTFKPNPDGVEVTLTEDWKKYDNDGSHFYFKYDATKYMELVIEQAFDGFTKEDFLIETDNFLEFVPEMTLYSEGEYTVEDRNIYTKAYEVLTDYSNFYEYFVFVEDGTNTPLLISLSIESLFTIDEVLEEVEFIVNNIKY